MRDDNTHSIIKINHFSSVHYHSSFLNFSSGYIIPHTSFLIPAKSSSLSLVPAP